MMLTAYLMALILIGTETSVKCVVPPCDHHMFHSSVEICLSDFNSSMETSGYQYSCPWPTVKRTYYKLKTCVDQLANMSWCKGRGSLIDTVFLEVHEMYFKLCGQVQDPPFTTLIMLIAPGIIVTLFLPIVCVHLATWETEMSGAGL